MRDTAPDELARPRETSELPNLSREGTAVLGKEIYEPDIRCLVEEDHKGEVVAIDLGSGSYAIGKDAIAASEAFGGNSRATRLADAGRASGAVSLRGQFPAEAQLIEGFVNASL
ncbi:MAG: hypothetical protein OXI16_03900 [Chloroflexota bacterium]|nr:hypothetical protein [Chloroflexota bacterium]